MYTPPLDGREPSLFRKISEVQGAIGAINPEGSMQVEGRRTYEYITESQLLHAIRPMLAERKVAAFVSAAEQTGEMVGVTKKDGKPGTISRASVTMEVTFADGESGETFSVRGQGQGHDYGDKAIYKAMTSANRYLWWKMMLVGTDADDAAATPTGDDYALAGTAGEPAARPGAPAAPAQPSAPTAPKRPTSAAKKLTTNLFEQLQRLDPTREWERLTDEWIVTRFHGRGRGELSAAELDIVNAKLEKSRDSLLQAGAAEAPLGATQEESDAALAAAGMTDDEAGIPGMAEAMDAAAEADAEANQDAAA